MADRIFVLPVMHFLLHGRLLGRSLFLLKKQVSGPRTAKSQRIWIKFCTHLLLYEIHLWADFRDRHLGGSRPNQNDYVFL